jgi:hypothetical protein
MAVTVKAAVPVFWIALVCAGLVVPTLTLPKARLLGLRLIVGAVATQDGSAAS